MAKLTENPIHGSEDFRIPGDALDAAINAARIADPVIETPDGRRFAFVPNDFALRDISDPHLLSPFPKSQVIVDDRESLSRYANRFSGTASILLADYDALSISARLDWHTDNQATTPDAVGPDAHSVTLRLRPSEEFRRWDAIEGKMLPQDEFAAFLEENSVDITMPEAAVMVEVSRDLEATTAQAFKSSTRLENGDRAFRFETETRVENSVVVPSKFAISIPIYQGEHPETLTAAFRFRATSQGLLLGFEWRRVEYQRQAHFAAIAHQAAEETGLPVFFGRH